ncbi:MAG: phosphoribosyltransferase family protein [Acidimicrobiales bacterium]
MSQTFQANLGSQHLDLPIVEVAPDLAIALFISTDVKLSIVKRAAEELAELLAPSQPEMVVTAATMGIPMAMATAMALGLEDLTVLHKTAKIHLADALVEPLSSITTEGSQVLRLDQARVPMMAGRRVAFIDDVISTGSSAAAALRLIRRAEAEVVSIGTALLEGSAWEQALKADTDRTFSLGSIPLFRPRPEGWVAT